MQTYQIIVSWTEVGMVLIKADNIESAIKKAEETVDDITLPNGEYLSESFQIDKDVTKILYKYSESTKHELLY